MEGVISGRGNKIVELECFMKDHVIDVMSLNETFLNIECRITIPGYVLIRKDRAGRGGGVAFAVKENFRYARLKLPIEFESFEIIALKFWSENKEMILVTIYSPPRELLPINLLRFVETIKGEMMILADLNTSHSLFGGKSDTYKGQSMLDYLETGQFAFIPIPETTWEVEGRAPSTPDIILTKRELLLSVSNVYVTRELESDHAAVIIVTRFNEKKIELKTN